VLTCEMKVHIGADSLYWSWRLEPGLVDHAAGANYT
jgi:hypothetical protein